MTQGEQDATQEDENIFLFWGSLCICDKNEEPPNLKFCIMQGEQDVMQEGENIFSFEGSLPM